MKARICFSVVALAIGVQTAFADYTKNYWEMSVDEVPSYCRFFDREPVELVYNVITQRFEMENPGGLRFQAQGIKAVSYTTDSMLWRAAGEVPLDVEIGEAIEWDLSQISLQGPDGVIESVPLNCSQSAECTGKDFRLPSNLLPTVYSLSVEGSMAPPDEFSPIGGETYFVNFSLQCLE